MSTKLILLLSVCLGALVTTSLSHAGCFDYTEGLTDTVPVYRICNPSGECEEAKLCAECSSQNLSLQQFDNGMAWYATPKPDAYRVESIDGVLCRGETNCSGWTFEEIKICPPDAAKRNAEQGGADPELVYSFTSKIVDAFRDRDMEALIGLLEGNPVGPRIAYLKRCRFDDVFSEEFRQNILDAGPTCYWFNYKGDMIGSGHVGFGHGANGLRITTINGGKPEAYPTPKGWVVDGSLVGPDSFFYVDDFNSSIEAYETKYGIKFKGLEHWVGQHPMGCIVDKDSSYCLAAPVQRKGHWVYQESNDNGVNFENTESREFYEYELIREVDFDRVKSRLVPHLGWECIKAYVIRILFHSGTSSSVRANDGIYGLFKDADGKKVIVPLYWGSVNECLDLVDELGAGTSNESQVRSNDFEKNTHVIGVKRINNLTVRIGNNGRAVQLDVGEYSHRLQLPESSLKFMFFSRSYKPFFKAMDGVPEVGGDLLSVSTSSIDKKNLFRFFSEERSTFGVFYGSAGASGGSSATLLLLDTKTGQHAEIEYLDFHAPKWIERESLPPLLAEQSKIFYIGSRASMIGVVSLPVSIKKFHFGEWVFFADGSNEYWRSQLYNTALTGEEVFALLDYPKNDDSASIFDGALKKAFTLLYCSKKIEDEWINNRVKSYLSADLIEELKIYADELFVK